MDKKTLTEYGLLIVIVLVVSLVLVSFALFSDTLTGVVNKTFPSKNYTPARITIKNTPTAKSIPNSHPASMMQTITLSRRGIH